MQRRSLNDEIGVALTAYYERQSVPGRARKSLARPLKATPTEDAQHSADVELERDVPSPATDVLAELRAYVTRGLLTQDALDGCQFQGVYKHGRRWRAILWEGGKGKRRILGSYSTPEEAALARLRFLDAEDRRASEAALSDELQLGTVLRPELRMHPAYEAWVMEEAFKVGDIAPCPFEPGVRYTVDPTTLAVTRDEDGVVVIKPNVWTAKPLPRRARG